MVMGEAMTRDREEGPCEWMMIEMKDTTEVFWCFKILIMRWQ